MTLQATVQAERATRRQEIDRLGRRAEKAATKAEKAAVKAVLAREKFIAAAVEYAETLPFAAVTIPDTPAMPDPGIVAFMNGTGTIVPSEGELIDASDRAGNALWKGAPVRVHDSSRFGTVNGLVQGARDGRVVIDLDLTTSDRRDTLDEDYADPYVDGYTSSQGRVELLTA